jgi:hypothetical protein
MKDFRERHFLFNLAFLETIGQEMELGHNSRLAAYPGRKTQRAS